jgi:hypothetical protein
VWDWKKAMGRRQYKGVEQLPYWQLQLQNTAPDTPSRDFVINTMREQVARFGEEQFAALLSAWTKTRLIPPVTVRDLLAPEVVRSVWGSGIPTYAPVHREGGSLQIRPDPFGYDYALLDGRVISPGWQIHREKQRSGLMTKRLATLAKTSGKWPETLAEAKAAGLELDDLPAGCRWRLENQSIVLETDPPPKAPWDPTK